MIKALSLHDIFCNVANRYEKDEQRIIGIMLARYNIQAVKEMIDECFLYWDYNTGEFLDIFWCGYGEYAIPNGNNIIPVPGGDHPAYFDICEFIRSKDQLNNLVKGRYNDNIQLILINYYNHRLYYDESVRIDVEKSNTTNTDIREFMEWLINECRGVSNVQELIIHLNTRKAITKLKGASISDVISAATGIAGLFI